MEEKMLVLKMLESGKINAEDAYKLLNAIDNNSKSKAHKQTNFEKQNVNKDKKYLFISLEKHNGEKSNVKIPVSIARMGINAGSKFSKNLNGININEIINQLEKSNEIFTIENEENEIITFKLI